MISGIRTAYKTLFIVTVSSAVLLFALDTFGAFSLKQVTLDGEVVPLEASLALGFAPGSSVLRQSLDATAVMMCRRVGIGAAHVAVTSAHTIDIRTNQFEPEFLIHDAKSKRLRALTKELIVAPLDTESGFKSAPMFIGLAGLKLFERPQDFRLEEIAHGLRALQERDQEIFAAVSVIDCSEESYLTVSFLNTELLLLTTSLNVGESIEQLQAIVFGASDLTQESKIIDMRFEGLMIIPGEKESKSKRTKKRRNG